jgi:tetratricopeptide (TPR) repeat protein
MGVVYRAQGSMGQVAVKVMLPQGQDDPEELARFQVELRALGLLRHPGIVRVHDAGTDAGRPYLVMELLEGESLDARLRRKGALSPRRAAWVGAKLARALAHAHEHNVVHRDLKPANVFLTRDGEPVLVDFGLARVRGGALTATGDLLGTPLYMAPEQATGDRSRIGPATDIYGLGAVLYRCLADRPPFSTESLNEVLEAIRFLEPKPLSRYCEDLPPGLEQVILRCMAKDPADRWGSAAELSHALLPFAEGPESASSWRQADPPRATVRKRRPLPRGALLGLGMLVAVGVGAVVAVAQRRAPAGPAASPSPTAAPSLAGSPAPVRPSPRPTPSVTPADVLLTRARALSDDGDLQGARALVERVLAREPEHLGARALTADLLLRQRDPERALREAQWVLSVERDHVLALFVRAQVVAARAKSGAELNDALRDLDRIVTRQVDHTGARLMRAKIYFTRRELAAAQSEAQEAARLAPDDPEPWSVLGTMAMQRGHLERALEAFDRVVELRPDQADSYFNRGTARNMAGDPKRSLTDFDRAVELAPDAWINYVHRAIVHNDLHDTESALTDLAHALELDPNAALALINRGKIYMDRGEPGDVERALEDLERAGRTMRTKDPQYAAVKATVKQLRRQLGKDEESQ